jgi:hypothetical protein
VATKPKEKEILLDGFTDGVKFFFRPDEGAIEPPVGASYARSQFDALRSIINIVEQAPHLLHPGSAHWMMLSERLLKYEESRDHDHGRGPIAVNRQCAGGDCIINQARQLLKGALP